MTAARSLTARPDPHPDRNLMTATITTKSPIADLKLGKRINDELERWSIKTVADLTRRSLRDIDLLGGMRPGDAEAVEAKLAAHGLEFTPSGGWINTCTSCPACPDCGGLRAADVRNVVTDAITGRARHVGIGMPQPCDPCDAHHRSLVAARALELAGRLL